MTTTLIVTPPPAPAPEPAPAPAPAPVEGAPVLSTPALRAPREPSANPVAIAVNNPVGWYRGTFGASLYVGFAGHHAVRGNFTRYEDSESPLIIVALATGGDDFASHSGPVTDYGVSYVWYPRALWSGFMFEVGALRRDRDTRESFEDTSTTTHSTTYGVRGMVGWSWSVRGRAFVAAAVGFSTGRETGAETTTKTGFPSGHMPSTTTPISRQQPDGEAYLRLGFTLDP